MEYLDREIEQLRNELEKLVRAKGIDDSEVITASTVLDKVLNDYHMKMKRTAKIRQHRLAGLLEKRK